MGQRTPPAAASAGAVAYFRMDPPPTETSRDVVTYQPRSSAMKSVVGGDAVSGCTPSLASPISPKYVYAETPWTAAS